MKTRPVPIPAEALRARLAAAGFLELSWGNRAEQVYELAHHVDPRYTVRVDASPRGDVRIAAVRSTDRASAEAASLEQLIESAGADVVFRIPAVDRRGTLGEVLDRVVDGVREAYSAINRHRLSANLRVQAQEVSIRALQAELRRRVV
jgi:hypothetical protein